MLKVLYYRILVLLVFTNHVAYGGTAYLSNGFFITNRVHEFNKVTGTIKCAGAIKYPEIYREDTEIIERLNDTIKDFVESYNVCNIEDPMTIDYEIREGSPEYFSIKWTTLDSKKIPLMINCLSFAKINGRLLTTEDILSPLAKSFLPEFVKLSENHLATDITWEQLLTKIEQRYIQFCNMNSKWYIIFNTHHGISKKIVETELPNYLLKS